MAQEKRNSSSTEHRPASSDEEKTDPNLALPPELRKPTPPPAPGKKAVPRMPEMGPLDVFMRDPTITEIMVNDTRNVMIERGGKLIYSGFAYQSIDELNRLTRNILDITGRILSFDQPYVDTILPDGSRVNIVAPPLTVGGPCLTIRKFPSRRMNMLELVSGGMFDRRIATFLDVCVKGRMNLLISGGTGSGKTTLLNALIESIPKGERIVTIEDTPELAIVHANSVSMQTKPQMPGSPAITARELVANALRMRPDRIIVGESRKGEAFDMLQAMNTGHGGSMTTIHANSTRDALSRVETLCLMAGVDLPLIAIRKQMNSALDLVIQIKRFRSGSRRITGISEVTGVEGDTILLQELFSYETDPKNAANSDAGVFKSTGLIPTFMERLQEQGVDVPKGLFS